MCTSKKVQWLLCVEYNLYKYYVKRLYYVAISVPVLRGCWSRLLLQGLFVVAPSVEAFCEAFRFLVLQREEELARTIGLLDSHMLDVNLKANTQSNVNEIITNKSSLLSNNFFFLLLLPALTCTPT